MSGSFGYSRHFDQIFTLSICICICIDNILHKRKMNVPNSLAGLKILLLLLLLNLNSLKSFASPTKIAKNWDVPEDPGYGTINYYSQLLCQNQTESFSYALNTCFVTSQGQSVLYSCGKDYIYFRLFVEISFPCRQWQLTRKSIL